MASMALANSLAKFSQVNRDSWDEQLAAVVYAYNSAVQVCYSNTSLFTTN